MENLIQIAKKDNISCSNCIHWKNRDSEFHRLCNRFDQTIMTCHDDFCSRFSKKDITQSNKIIDHKNLYELEK